MLSATPGSMQVGPASEWRGVMWVADRGTYLIWFLTSSGKSSAFRVDPPVQANVYYTSRAGELYRGENLSGAD